MKEYPQVKCPTCGKRGDWLACEFGPFCSKRCKWIDLGKWFNEQNMILEPLTPENLENHHGELGRDFGKDDGRRDLN